MSKPDGEAKGPGVRKVGTLMVEDRASDADADLGSLSVGMPSSPPTGNFEEDDDGRLDLRSLSASTLGRTAFETGGSPPGGDSGEARVEDAAAPAIEPPRAVERRPSAGHWLMPLAAGFGLGLAAGALLFGGGERSVAPGASVAGSPSVQAVAPSEAPAVAAPPTVPEVGGTVAVAVAGPSTPTPPPVASTQAAAAAEATASTNSLPHASSTRAEVSPPHPRGHHAPEPALAVAPSPPPPANEAPVVRLTPQQAPAPPASEPPAPQAATQSGAARSMDQLLDQALSGDDPLRAATAAKPASVSAGPLPATPSREEVAKAMAVLLPAIRGCAMGQSGMATAGIVVRNDGRVASVSISGAPFAGSASGRCMEGVVRRARFPHFTQPTFRIKYPLAIQ